MANTDLKVRISAQDKTGTAFKGLRASLSKMRNAIFSVQTAVAGLAGATGFGLLVKSTIETNREFQSLEASLTTFLGSTEKAQGAFEILQKFAAQTPFALREVVGGFNKLVARGLNPTIKSLVAFGNIASGTGKTLDQFIEAAADAAVGEFERLKEFGIKARSEGDKVVFTFKGVETEVNKSAASISDFLVVLGETEFAGAIAAQSKTLNGAFSNLGDSFDSFKKQIGEAGFNESLVNLAKFFSNIAGENDNLAKSIGRLLAGGVNLIPTIFNKIGNAADFVSRNLDFLRKSLIVVTAGIFAKMFISQAIAVLYFAKSLLSAKKAAIAFQAAQKLLTIGTLAAVVIIGKMTDTLDDIVGAITRAVDEAIIMADKVFPGLKGSLESLLPSLDGNIEALTEMSKNNDISIESTKELDDALKKLLGNMNSGKEATEDYTKALKEFAEEAENIEKSLSNVALRGVQSLEDALVSVAMKTSSVKDAFRSMANSIISDLIRMQIRKSVTGPLSDALSGFFKPAAPSAPGGMIGGPMRADRPRLVGERGPELFVPTGTPGSLIPNNKLSGGGVTIVQNINVSTGVQQTVRAEVMQMLPQISNAAKGAVLDARRRGGSFAPAF